MPLEPLGTTNEDVGRFKRGCNRSLPWRRSTARLKGPTEDSFLCLHKMPSRCCSQTRREQASRSSQQSILRQRTTCAELNGRCVHTQSRVWIVEQHVREPPCLLAHEGFARNNDSSRALLNCLDCPCCYGAAGCFGLKHDETEAHRGRERELEM